jgi:DNA-directed RNA polymerase specialized sigma24 family protein
MSGDFSTNGGFPPLDKLPNSEYRAIALWKMQGHPNEEIAARLGCAVATVERRLRVIRRLWEKEQGM